jgi:hypothetical protein
MRVPNCHIVSNGYEISGIFAVCNPGSPGELIAHRVNGVLRIADADLHSFLARHRETLVLLSWIVMQCQRSTNYREYSMRILRISVLW